MKTADALAHYGTQKKLAEALGVARQTISLWGVLVPGEKAIILNHITDGSLKIDAEAYVKQSKKRSKLYRGKNNSQ
jgi:DNA-binding transcriptional regulator YdaS (Cro superfamily)